MIVSGCYMYKNEMLGFKPISNLRWNKIFPLEWSLVKQTTVLMASCWSIGDTFTTFEISTRLPDFILGINPLNPEFNPQYTFVIFGDYCNYYQNKKEFWNISINNLQTPCEVDLNLYIVIYEKCMFTYFGFALHSFFCRCTITFVFL